MTVIFLRKQRYIILLKYAPQTYSFAFFFKDSCQITPASFYLKDYLSYFFFYLFI